MESKHTFSAEKLPQEQPVDSNNFKPDTTELSSHYSLLKTAAEKIRAHAQEEIKKLASFTDLMALRVGNRLDQSSEFDFLGVANEPDYNPIEAAKLGKAA